MTLQISDINSALGAMGASSTIGRVFEFASVAEEEIAAGKKRYPEKAKTISLHFMELCPPSPMVEFSDELYRAYVRERIEQLVHGRPRTATNAEAAMTICLTSGKTPIHWEYTAAYWLAMCEMFGEKKMQELTGEQEHPYTVSQFKEAQECLLGVKNDINRRIKNEEAKVQKVQVPQAPHRQGRVPSRGHRGRPQRDR